MNDRKAVYTKSLGKKVANGAAPDKISKIHVIIGSDDKWSVIAEGSTRSIKTDLNRNKAVEYAKKIAANKSASYIVIHNKVGKSSKRIKV